MQTPTTTQKAPTTPPPAPAAAAPAPQAAQAKAPAPTGYGAAGVQDGFETARKAPPAVQGDAFQAAAPAPATLTAPAGGEAPVLRKDQMLSALREYAQQEKVAAVLKDPVVMENLKKVLQGVEADPTKQPDPNDPTAGMTPEELEAYQALSPEERARYDELHRQAATNHQTSGVTGVDIATPDSSVQALRDLLASGQFADYLVVEKALEGSPEAQQDLQQILFQGRLPGPTSDVDFKNTLDNLVELATGDLIEGLDNVAVLESLLRDVNHPEQIAQGINNPYCAGAEYAFGMALFDPAEYVRMITGLATDGQVEMTGIWARIHGAESQTVTFNGPFEVPDKHGRSPTQQLFGETVVEEAQAGDSSIERLVEAIMRDGIDGVHVKDLLNEHGFLGGGWDALFLPPPGKDGAEDPRRGQAEAVVEDMLATANDGNLVYAQIDGHWVTVVGYDEASGTVTYHDPATGEIVEKPLRGEGGFMEGLNSLVYQEAGSPEVPEFMHNEDWAKDGGGGSPIGGLGGGGNYN